MHSFALISSLDCSNDSLSELEEYSELLIIGGVKFMNWNFQNTYIKISIKNRTGKDFIVYMLVLIHMWY